MVRAISTIPNIFGMGLCNQLNGGTGRNGICFHISGSSGFAGYRVAPRLSITKSASESCGVALDRNLRYDAGCCCRTMCRCGGSGGGCKRAGAFAALEPRYPDGLSCAVGKAACGIVLMSKKTSNSFCVVRARLPRSVNFSITKRCVPHISTGNSNIMVGSR